MRVRPATPLSVVLFVAFALLLISVLSTPIIQAVPLGKFRDFSFGVFGWCKGSSCSSLSIGYNPSMSLLHDLLMLRQRGVCWALKACANGCRYAAG